MQSGWGTRIPYVDQPPVILRCHFQKEAEEGSLDAAWPHETSRRQDRFKYVRVNDELCEAASTQKSHHIQAHKIHIQMKD